MLYLTTLHWLICLNISIKYICFLSEKLRGQSFFIESIIVIIEDIYLRWYSNNSNNYSIFHSMFFSIFQISSKQRIDCYLLSVAEETNNFSNGIVVLSYLKKKKESKKQKKIKIHITLMSIWRGNTNWVTIFAIAIYWNDR